MQPIAPCRHFRKVCKTAEIGLGTTPDGREAMPTGARWKYVRTRYRRIYFPASSKIPHSFPTAPSWAETGKPPEP